MKVLIEIENREELLNSLGCPMPDHDQLLEESSFSKLGKDFALYEEMEEFNRK